MRCIVSVSAQSARVIGSWERTRRPLGERGGQSLKRIVLSCALLGLWASMAMAQACIENSPGLTGWWRGNSSADDAAAGNNGTLVNGAYAAGRVGQAFSLDGATGYVEGIGDAFSYSFIENTGIFTIDAWIYLPDVGTENQQAITASTGTSTEKGHFFIWDNTGGAQKLRLGLMKFADGVPVIDSSSPNQVITTNGWHHVAAVGNGTTITFYVDGVGYPGTGTMSSKPAGPSTRSMNIGRCPPALACMFNGLVDEVQVYDRALSASEVLTIYNAGGDGMCGTGCVQSIPGLVGWWPGSGDGNDRSVSKNHADVALVGFGPGRVGQAFSFNGTTAYVANLGGTSSYSFVENTGVFTIDAWINLNVGTPGQQAITASTGTSTEKGHFFIWENSAGEQKLRLGLMKAISSVPVIESSSPNQVITTNGWHHVAAVGNGTTITFYVDGVGYPGTGTMSAKPSGGSTRAVDIGRCPAITSQCLFSGLIDEVQIFDRALSSSEIQSLYQAGSSGMCGLGLVVGVEDPPPAALLPGLELLAPRPNPGRGGAQFFFRLPEESRVSLEVFDMAGRRVARLVSGELLPQGPHAFTWDGRGVSGRRVSSGVYLVRLAAGHRSSTQRLVMTP